MIDQNLIYDVGAHLGEDTEFYLKRGFSVVAVEASPTCCEIIFNKFGAYVQSGQLRILQICVSEQAGKVDFFVNDKQTIWSTANPEWVERNAHVAGKQSVRRIEVQAQPLSAIFAEFGVPRYCKIDIEGNDLAAVRSLAASQQPPPFLSIESEKRSWKRLIEEFSTLHRVGYRRFKVINQKHVPLQTSPSPPREGLAADHQFAEGSSGLFGEDLPGPWLDLAGAIETYKPIFVNYFLTGDYGAHRHDDRLPSPDWYDTHAAL